MRIHLIVLILISFLFSCTSDKNGETKVLNNNMSDTLVPFTGLWLNKKYETELLKSKSPKEAQETVNMSCLYIPDSYKKNATIIYNFHEGDDEMKLLKTDSDYQFYSDHSNEKLKIGYSPANISLNVGVDTFIKLKQPLPTDDLPKILEEVLFSGHYKSGDRYLVFKEDGTITGSDSLKYYSPMVDYMDEGLQVDQLLMGVNKDQAKTYGFKFVNDSLYIYDLHCKEIDSLNNFCADVEFGMMRFKMCKVD